MNVQWGPFEWIAGLVVLVVFAAIALVTLHVPSSADASVPAASVSATETERGIQTSVALTVQAQAARQTAAAVTATAAANDAATATVSAIEADNAHETATAVVIEVQRRVKLTLTPTP
jgi:hypothetical protein